MSRLIDANNLNFEGKNYNKCQIKAILDFIDAQPTAYDEEKVVEEIMVLHYEGFCPSEDTLECVLDKSCSDCYRERINEIVRKGGVE